MTRLNDFVRRNTPVLLISVATLAGLIVAGLVGCHFFFGADLPLVQMHNYQSAAYWGQLGDFVGGMLNPLLSFFALVAVAVSLGSQKKDSESALRDSRISIENQMNQTSALQRQSFETVFFSLLNLQSNCLNNVRHTTPEGEVKRGVEAFDAIQREFPQQQIQEAVIPGGRGNADRILGIFNAYKAKHVPSLRHYIEIVEQILMYIDTFPAEAISDKSRYFGILRAMLSVSEIKLLGYYINTTENSALKDIVARTRIFHNDENL